MPRSVAIVWTDHPFKRAVPFRSFKKLFFRFSFLWSYIEVANSSFDNDILEHYTILTTQIR
jgi:hypothetical protein